MIIKFACAMTCRALVILMSMTALVTFFSPVYAQELKIVYVNAVRVIEEAPQAKVALKKLEAEFKPRDQKLVEMQNKIKKIEDTLEKDALVMKSSARRSMEKDLITLKRNLRRATQEFREDYNLRRNEELASLQKTVYKAIVEIAKEKNYDLVVHEGTIYASRKIDITEIVLKHLSKKR